MSANARNVGGSRPTAVLSSFRGNQSSARFVRLSHLHKLRECEQVAAVCYRVRDGGIEFLLVRTRGGGRWTFPKGSTEPGLTHAQAAALEAFEEAGVHGRIEEASFARYVCRRGAGRKSTVRSADRELAVNAHLCEVLWLGNPKESGRNRTWFSVEDARRRLREGRRSDDGAEFARVVDRAVARIQRLGIETGMATERSQGDPSQENLQRDALQKVQFEAVADASFIPHIQRSLRGMRQPYVTDPGSQQRKLLLGEVLQFSPAEKKRSHSLGAATKNH
jgi:8-oxo-dGTP pyrophosphatase MutT (NUDIX family)